MTGGRDAATAHALRALAHPLAVGALVLLALNDHVLKQAWPGWVTGKLSDLAGLVVAPLVLALPLGWLRVRRPALLAVLLTGAGFTTVKTTAVGAAVASATWSAVAGPSYLLRDPSDLLALPALLLALRVHRLTAVPSRPLRRRATAAAGAVVLPFAVLATAATSPCDDRSWSHSLTVLDGRWESGADGWQWGARIVYGEQYVLEPAAGGLGVRVMSDAERGRVTSWGDDHAQELCDPARPRLCWRTYDPTRTGWEDPTEVETVVVYASRDGGLTWSEETVLDEAAVRAVRDEAGEVCGKPLQVGTGGLAALSGDRGPVVVVSLGGLGIAVRDAGGAWTRFAEDRIAHLAVPAPIRSPTPTGDPLRAARRHPIRPVDVPLPVTERTSPTPSYPTPTGPPCELPVAVTVTPDPRNGQPFVDLRCQATPS